MLLKVMMLLDHEHLHVFELQGLLAALCEVLRSLLVEVWLVLE